MRSQIVGPSRCRQAHLGLCKQELPFLLCQAIVQHFTPLGQGAVDEHLPVLVEAVKGVQADLHLDVCHLHILTLARTQDLQGKMQCSVWFVYGVKECVA